MTISFSRNDARSYVSDIMSGLNPSEKTLVLFSESMKSVRNAAGHIMGELGEWIGADPDTGFELIDPGVGQVLKLAELMDAHDDPRVSPALKDPLQKNNRDHVDIIIANYLALEDFDWSWCEHALTVGYPSTPTEVVQIIDRAAKNASDNAHVRFTNLFAAPDARE